jgi:protein-S-isoprenylcysteine O-methyltransferase Ste14
MSERPDNAGVRFPPPLLYVAAFAAGVLLDRRWRLPIGADTTRRGVAVLLLVAWAWLTVTSFRSFWRKRTSIIPIRPATALVITGPYRITRNPMYVGLALLTAAMSLLFDTWWPIMLLFPTLIGIQQVVIAPEERYLRRRFGDEYDAYTRRVRRWL